MLAASQARSLRDWVHYKKEASWAEALDDRARVELLREMYLLYLVFQRAKSPEQLAAEERAERRLNAWNLNPKYRSLLNHAQGNGGGSEDAR